MAKSAAINLALILLTALAAAIEDPLGIFCGSRDCYEVLGLERANADAKLVKKAYRQMSLRYHPDKYKGDDAADMFRLVAQAAEVLGDDEQRGLYDYYLDHPGQYYKVSGVHFYKSIPKTDVRFILAGGVILLSILLPFLQHQRYKDSVRIVRDGLPVNGGGTNTSVRLHQLCVDKYKDHMISAEAASASKTSSKSGAKKMSQIIKDPVFSQIVVDTIAELNLDGPFRKPGISSILIVQILIFPYTIFNWLRQVSISACVYAVCGAAVGVGSTLSGLVRSGQTKAPEDFPHRARHDQVPAKPSKPEVLRAAPLVDDISEEGSQSEPDDPETLRRAEDSCARGSLQRLLLSRVVGNSKKKLSPNSEEPLPFSKAEIKYICSRVSGDDARSLLQLSVRGKAQAADDQGRNAVVCICTYFCCIAITFCIVNAA